MSSSPDADMVMNGTGDDGDSVTVRSQGQDGTNNTTYPPNNADVPKPKRLACMICRKRKLRCDGNRPRCATCTRLGHDCAYDEVRRKSGPKRGYVKALEERLSAFPYSYRARISYYMSKRSIADHKSYRASRDAAEDTGFTSAITARCQQWPLHHCQSGCSNQ